jgi:DNA-binding NarL/FixJ family response regulator
MINILTIDDHAMFRSGLRKVLEDEPDMRVIGEAGEWADGLAQIARLPVDLVLLDINLPGRSGLEVLEVICKRHPTVHTVMLSMYAEPQYARRALTSGARGYISKDMEASDLINTVRGVMKGQKIITPALMSESLLDPVAGGAEEAPPHTRFSLRETQIFTLIVQGRSLTAIADELSIHVKTVSTYRQRVLEKLGLSSNAEMVQYAVRHGAC